ncbi:MAG: glutathione S-transferase [Caulobacterales bacterium]|nr:glutathione S-transferase [Caulobacterales bacterium]
MPVLHVGGDVIWDSLAIAEWAHEQAPAAKLWPDDPRLRTVGRAAAATMHAGFAALRDAAPMNLHRRGRSRDLGAAALADVAALERVWAHTRSFAGEGPFLLGPWSIADVMAAPYATRLRSYAIAVGPATSAYGEAVFADGDFRDWERTACDDPRRLEHVDAF